MALRAPERIVAIAIAIAVVLSASCVGPGTTPGPTRSSAAPTSNPSQAGEPANPSPTSFSSAVLPYTLGLPSGWVELSTSADEDIFESADMLWSLTVGTGHPEPGQTVEDRVRINRESEFAGCDTDPDTDRAVTVGGEPGILWAFTCGPLSGLAANTIHGGVGYRLTLKVPGDAAGELEAVMAGILATFAFTG